MVEGSRKKTAVLAKLSLIFGCLFIVPLLGLFSPIPAIILGIVALVKIFKEGNNLKGRGLAIGGIVLGVVGMLIITAAVKDSLRARKLANGYVARGKVMDISEAIEIYAKANNGKYPVSESVFLDGDALYLAKSYDNQVIHGYR